MAKKVNVADEVKVAKKKPAKKVASAPIEAPEEVTVATPEVAEVVQKTTSKKEKDSKIIGSIEKSELDEKIRTSSKQELIDMFSLKQGDTGSPEVQIALATQKILNLTQHLNENPKDNHSRRGLLKIIAKRRRIIHYLQEKDQPRYKDLIAKLGLKR